MKRPQRLKWILAQLAPNGIVDVLNADFVDSYIQATGASYVAQAFGAHKCPMLGRDLSNLYKGGLLRRRRVNLPGAETGFPRWVYSYTCAPLRKDDMPCAD